MDISFEIMTPGHKKEVMDIFNYYVSNSFSAFPERELPLDFFDNLIELTGILVLVKNCWLKLIRFQ